MEISLDLNFIRYINLLEEVSNVRAKNCFIFNNILFFVVGKKDIKRAIGKNGKNTKIINLKLKKKVRILVEPKDNEEKIFFIKKMVEPLNVEKIEIKEKEVLIKTGLQERSMMIGRDRKKEKEMLEVLEKLFGIKKITFEK